MDSIYYVCPKCGEWSGSMQPLFEKHIMTPEQVRASRGTVNEHIGHELLRCSCGEKLTWFDMKEVWEYAVERSYDKNCKISRIFRK